MKAAARILLIFIATFMNAECFRAFEKRDDIGGCRQSIVTCAPTLAVQPYINQSSYDFGTLAPTIDQSCAFEQESSRESSPFARLKTCNNCIHLETRPFLELKKETIRGRELSIPLHMSWPRICCSEHQTAAQCLEPLLDSCQHYHRFLIETSRILTYFCSDLGRSLLREYQRSVCYTNFPAASEIHEICTTGANESNPADTGYYARLVLCIIRQYRQRCGEAGGQIVSDIINIVNQD